MSEGYQHPCSAKKYAAKQREVISLDCGSAQSGKNPDYSKPLYCRKTKTGTLSGNLSANMLAHTAYLYINFYNAIDLGEMSGSFMKFSKTSELTRTKRGDTNTRIILGTGKVVGDSTDLQFKSIFFTLNDLRPRNSKVTDHDEEEGGTMNPTVSSKDLLMNQQVFEELIKNMTPMNVEDLNPLSSDNMFQPTVFTDKEMPNVTGIYLPKTIQAAGKRTKKSSRKMKRKSRRKYK